MEPGKILFLVAGAFDKSLGCFSWIFRAGYWTYRRDIGSGFESIPLVFLNWTDDVFRPIFGRIYRPRRWALPAARSVCVCFSTELDLCSYPTVAIVFFFMFLWEALGDMGLSISWHPPRQFFASPLDVHRIFCPLPRPPRRFVPSPPAAHAA